MSDAERLPEESIPFSQELNDVIAQITKQAIEAERGYIDTGHLLLGLIKDRRNEAAQMLKRNGIGFRSDSRIRLAIKSIYDPLQDIAHLETEEQTGDPIQMPKVARALERAKTIAKETGAEEVSTAHVFIALFEEKSLIAVELEKRINVEKLKEELINHQSQ